MCKDMNFLSYGISMISSVSRMVLVWLCSGLQVLCLVTTFGVESSGYPINCSFVHFWRFSWKIACVCIYLSALQVCLLLMVQVSWDILVYWLVNVYTTFWEEHSDFKPLVAVYHSAQHSIPEISNLHHYCSENLKCHFICHDSSVPHYLHPEYKCSMIFVNVFLSHAVVILLWIYARDYTTVKPSSSSFNIYFMFPCIIV